MGTTLLAELLRQQGRRNLLQFDKEQFHKDIKNYINLLGCYYTSILQ